MFYLNILSFPLSMALNEIVLALYVLPPAPWYHQVIDVALNFLSGFTLAAINLLFHGFARLVESVVAGTFIAQTGIIVSMWGRTHRSTPVLGTAGELAPKADVDPLP